MKFIIRLWEVTTNLRGDFVSYGCRGWPPVTRSVSPVMNDAAPEHRNLIAETTSDISPRRLTSCNSAAYRSKSAGSRSASAASVAHEPRRDGVHADPVRREFGGEGRGEAADGQLGDAVGRGQNRPRRR